MKRSNHREEKQEDQMVEAALQESPAAGWRLKLSIALFGLSIILPLGGIPALTLLGLSGTMTATLSGGVLVTAEVLGIIAVAVAGKSGFAMIKAKVAGIFKHYGPPQKVSRLRYVVGLVMFFGPIVFGWVSIYAVAYLPGFTSNPFPYAISGDLLLLSGLFVLGGDFWDKLQSLFRHDAEAVFVDRSEK